MQAQTSQAPWGITAEGHPAHLYTLTNSHLALTLTNYGARIVTLHAPDRDGTVANIVLGYNDVASYEADSSYIGATIGRFANRIANGTFTLHGRVFHIPSNSGPNALHGGPASFDRKLWKADPTADSVEFTLLSPDGDMGFPGALNVCVRYTLIARSLQIDYTATTTRPTVLNLTHHTYFNLAGQSSATVLDHRLTLHADHYTPTDQHLIPLGPHASVTGTPFDFRTAKPIGEHIHADNQQLRFAHGYDHNFVLSQTPALNAIQSPAQTNPNLLLAANALDFATGRTLTVITTEPGIQLYTGNFLESGIPGFGGKPYRKHNGFCLETQHFPDSPNQPTYPSTELHPGNTFRSRTIYTFAMDREP